MMTCRRILPGVLALSLSLLSSGYAEGLGWRGICGPNVLSFGPESNGIQETISSIHSAQAPDVLHRCGGNRSRGRGAGP
jgi:hypothetical protein